MKPNYQAALVACALFAMVPSAGHSVTAGLNVEVTPTATGFMVENDAEHGARGMWCAAGSYVQSIGADAPEQRIYVAEGRTPGLGQRSPVQFTLDPSGLNPQPAFLVGASFRRAGTSMSVQHALSLCNALRGAGR